MTNPIDDYLTMRKEAVGPWGPAMGGRMLGGGGGFGKELGKSLQRGVTDAAGKAVGAGAVGIAATGIGVAALKAVRAIRKRSDFKNMMELNQDLQEQQQSDPERFNAHYNSLRALVPRYAEDPIISGSLMRQMGSSAAHAGSTLMTALESSSRTAPGANVSYGPLNLSSKLL